MCMGALYGNTLPKEGRKDIKFSRATMTDSLELLNLPGTKFRSFTTAVAAFNCRIVCPDPIVTNSCRKKKKSKNKTSSNSTVSATGFLNTPVAIAQSWETCHWCSCCSTDTRHIRKGKGVNHEYFGWPTIHFMTRFKWNTNEQAKSGSLHLHFQFPLFCYTFHYSQGFIILRG